MQNVSIVINCIEHKRQRDRMKTIDRLVSVLAGIKEARMPIKLTWSDLIIEDADWGELAGFLREWNWLLSGDVAPVFLSMFGDWLLRRRDDSVQKLDVLEGTLTTVADSYGEFRERVNTPEWQEEHLLSRLVYDLHGRGLVPAKGQCYSVAPHPVFGGRLEPEFIQVVDIPVWQSLCVQSFQAAMRHGEARRKTWWKFWRRA